MNDSGGTAGATNLDGAVIKKATDHSPGHRDGLGFLEMNISKVCRWMNPTLMRTRRSVVMASFARFHAEDCGGQDPDRNQPTTARPRTGLSTAAIIPIGSDDQKCLN